LPDTIPTLDTQDIGRRQTENKNTTQHTKFKRRVTRSSSKSGGIAPFVNYKKGALDSQPIKLTLLAHGRWFSPASSTTKTGRHDIAEILLKVALNTITNREQKHNTTHKIQKTSNTVLIKIWRLDTDALN
jgi:hypothetical protein